MQDFALFTPELLRPLSGPQTVMTTSLCDPFRQPDVNSDDLIFFSTCPCDNLPYFLSFQHWYSWLSLSRIRLTWISGWVKFLSKSRTSLCINIYNLTPVESNSDESKFRLSQIKVLVPRCRKPYYLHSLSQIMCITLGLKSDHRWNIRSLNLTFLP
jgi:hypothetical protein